MMKIKKYIFSRYLQLNIIMLYLFFLQMSINEKHCCISLTFFNDYPVLRYLFLFHRSFLACAKYSQVRMFNEHELCGWVRFSECGKLLYGMRFSLRLKWAVYGSYVRPAMLCGSEARCQEESEIGLLCRTKRSIVREMCGVQLKDRKRFEDLMLGLNETMDQMAIASSVCWYGHVLRREDGHVLRT